MAKHTAVKTKLSLPTAPNEPPQTLIAYTTLIFGRKNVGKSTLGSSYPNSINFQYERGRRNLEIVMLPEQGGPPLDLDNTRKYFDLVANSEFETAVIDTIDAFYDMVYRGVCEENGVTKPGDGGNGAEVWREVAQTVEDLLGVIQDAGKSLVLISHEKEKSHNNSDGTSLERLEPSCTGQATGVIQRMCDNVFHYDWVANDRVMTLRSPDNLVWTSIGLDSDRFLDPDGEPLRRIVIPNDPTKGYETLNKAFENKLRDYDWEPPKPVKSPKNTSSNSQRPKSTKK